MNVTVGIEILYVPFAISIFGLLGNTIAFLTIILSDLRKNYVNIYLLVLLCSDSVLLLDIFVQPLFRFDVLTFWTCAITEYLFNASAFVSSFSIISLTGERFFSIIFPLRHLKYSNSGRWKLIICWLVPTLFLNANVLFFALKNTENDSYTILVQSSFGDNVKCVYDYKNSSAYFLFYWPRLIFTFVLPVTIILIANLAIAFKVRSLNIIQGSSSSSSSSSSSADIKCNNVVLFVIPIVFVAFNLPFNVRSVLKFVLASVTNDSLYQKYYAFYSISFFLYCFNFSTNFIIYALASSLFRKALVKVWMEPIKKRITNQPNKVKVHPPMNIIRK
ncbi:hypothetical protein niasHT_011576 [Heterodera trifolii]|uniref:G-protein coupled receptors family 1 profile domain-containing protein n=1 Tax=Heterodera trifolii TaxID=157864 RepID=A0ABD2L7I6_9BILA